MKYNEGSGYTTQFVTNNSSYNKTEVYGRLWVYLTSAPSSGFREMVSVFAVSGQDMAIGIDTDRTIRLRSNYTDRGNTTTAISLNTWTVVKFHFKFAAASTICEVIIGAETKTDTTSLTTSDCKDIDIGMQGLGSAITYYMDDFVLDDAGYPADGGTPSRTPQTKIAPTRVVTQSEPTLHGTQLVVNSSTSNSATYFSASFTPVVGNLMLAFIGMTGTARANNQPRLPSQVCMRYATFANIGSIAIGSISMLSVWRAVSGSTVAGTLKVAFASPMTGCSWNVSQWDNAWAFASDNGSSAIVDFQTTVGTAITSATVTMSALGTRAGWDNYAAGFLTNTNQDIASQSPWMRIGTTGYATPTSAQMVEYGQAFNRTTLAASWASSSTTAGGMGVQIAASRQINTRSLSHQIRSILGLIRSIISGPSATARNAVIQIARYSTVIRKNWLIRASTVTRPPAFAVKRIGWYIRKISSGRAIVATVRGLRNLRKTLSTSHPTIYTLSRSRWLKRASVVQIFGSRTASRLSRRLRVVQTTIQSSLPVRGLRRLIRGVVSTLSVKAIVGKTSAIARAIRTSVSNAIQVKRIASYTRRISLAVVRTSTVKRIGQYIRRNNFAILLGLSVSRLKRLTRAISLTVVPSFSVKRLTRRLRTIGSAIALKSSVIRLGWYRRAISTVQQVKSALNRLSGAVTRSLRLAIQPISSVVRRGRYKRPIVSSVARNSSVSRIGWYKRAVSTIGKLKLSLSQSRIVGVAVRTASLAIQSTLRVSRRIWYKRYVVSGGGIAYRLSRIAYWRRRVASTLSPRFVANRILSRVRIIVTSIVPRDSVRYSRWFIRSSQAFVPHNTRASRVLTYVRRLVSRVGVKSVVSQLKGTGEAILLRVLALSGELIKYLSGSGKKTDYSTSVGEKTSYKSSSIQQTNFSSSSGEKEKYKD